MTAKSGSLGARVRRWWKSRTARNDAHDVDALREQLDDAYRQHSAGLAQVRRGVADVATSRKRIEVRLRSLSSQLETLDGEAKAAVERGSDDAARSILARRLTLEKAATELVARHEDLLAEEQRLVGAAGRLENEIEDFRLRRDTLTARYSAATARAEIASATTGIASTNSEVGQAMAEAERHTRELEATADAVDELVAEGIMTSPGESTDDALARRIDAALAGTEVTEGDVDGPNSLSP